MTEHNPPPGTKVNESPWGRDWREPKACEECGFVRTVHVHESRRQVVDVITTEYHWSKRCTACDLERRASVHAQSARTFARKALAIRERRSPKKGGSR